jgi:hypothetical protein
VRLPALRAHLHWLAASQRGSVGEVSFGSWPWENDLLAQEPLRRPQDPTFRTLMPTNCVK